MDAQRFDDLARLIGSGATRRRVLTLLGGGVTALLSRRLPVQAQCVNPEVCRANDECCAGFFCDDLVLACFEDLPPPPECGVEGDPCDDDHDCCFGVCIDAACQCLPQGSPCTDEFQCCQADAGFSSCINGVCAVCREISDTCTNNAECCDFGDCFEGVCVFCRELGSPCEISGQCCNGACAGGLCVTCAFPDEPCGVDAPCCSGLACQSGSCVPCTPPGEPCADSSACCDGTCEDGLCVSPFCRNDGLECSDPNECCSQSCFGGVCSNCAPPTGVCVTGAECCSGSCGRIGPEGEGICLACRAAGRACAEDAVCCSNHCTDGFCTQATCGADPDCAVDERCVDGSCTRICTADDQCQVDAVCCAGTCRQVECCIDDTDPDVRCPVGTTCVEGICAGVNCAGEGESCAASAECCGNLICAGGICQVRDDTSEPPDDDDPDDDEVTQLPDTGVGAVDADRKSLLGLASLAAGAAALLGRAIRK